MKHAIRSSPSLKQFFAALLAVALLMSLGGARKAQAAPGIRVIDITAQRFSFTPSQITLKKGETVKLRLTSQDVTHGFFSRPLKVDEDIEAGDAKEITLTPQTAGTYTIICDHFCGVGHGNMNMTIVVE